MTESKPLLICQEITRRFGSLVAVNNISATVKKGEILGIGGPNGAGKTTFFDVITGITPASGGRIIFDGHNVTRFSADHLCRLGMARTFQLNAAFDHMTVLDNVEIAAYFGNSSRLFPALRIGDETRKKAADTLEFVGLSDKSNMLVTELSVLDRKLLMIASAMATQPRILFLDEPVGGLNSDETDFVIDLVRRLTSCGLTIILIEHVMRFLLTLSTRVLIMHHGSVIFEGPPDQVAKNDRVVEVYLGNETRQRLVKHFAISTKIAT